MGRRGLLCTTSSPSPRECHTQLLALVIHWVATLVSVRTLWKSPFQKWVLRGQVELPPRGPGRRGPLPSPGSCLQAASACRVVRSGKPADAAPGADTEGTGFDGDGQRELDGAATQTGRACPGRPCPDPPAGQPLLPRVWRRDLKGCERHGAGTLTSHTPAPPATSSARACFIHSLVHSFVRSGPRVFRDVPRPTLPPSPRVAGRRRTPRQAEGGRAPAGTAVRVHAGRCLPPAPTPPVWGPRKPRAPSALTSRSSRG